MGIKSKILNFKECAINSMIYREYYEGSIDENLVYLESRDGLDFTGNIFRIVEELSTGKYGDLKIHVHAKKQVHPKIEKLKKHYNLKIDKIITKEAMATKTLEKAKYIITDSGIRPKYIKKQGQIFINTWHGTPLKLMGFDNIAEEHRIANVQHPLLSSDYLIYPNDYMREKMMNAYMIDRIYPGKILLEGYPRNSVFFDENKRAKFKELLNLKDKEIFIYMPTFRGIFMNRNDEEQKNEVYDYLVEIDEKLNDNQILLVKLHVLNQAQIDFSSFRHIQIFPDDYETYDVLNIADVLISDYSSVFFDFANTRHKIVLFNYDEEEYMSYRGTYLSLDELPFPKVQNVDDLIDELNCPKNYDDSEFLDKFCTYDRPDAAEHICQHIFNSKKSCREETVDNDKENVLIYAGGLVNNGITSSLLNLINNIDRSRYNYFITFHPWHDNIKENHEEIFKRFPDDIQFLPFRLYELPTVTEKLDYNNYYLSNNPKEFSDKLKRLFKRSFERQYPNIPFRVLIDFDGYTQNLSFKFSNSGIRNVSWIHNDMIQENKLKGNQNLNVLKDVYAQSDEIVVAISITAQISGSDLAQFNYPIVSITCPNCNEQHEK